MVVGLQAPGELLPVPGIRLAAVSAGLRKTPGLDLVLLELAAGSQCAAVFTQNHFCAAPVQVAKQHLSTTLPRYFLINSANANAGTGEQGMLDAYQCCEHLGRTTGCDTQSVLPFSTGVIGEPLPVDKISTALPVLVGALREHHWLNAARGIMTTDTLPKAVSRQVELAGQPVTITGIAKGSGMICPNMATMLAYIATDAKFDSDSLKKLHKDAVEQSFNCISVDGDTSTNDACMLVATGVSDVKPEEGTALYNRFVAALQSVYTELAQAIVRDGEGATKFVAIKVEQGLSKAESKNVAYTIAHSPLVKTAFYASDANWGRILAAVGRADFDKALDVDMNKVIISINGLAIFSQGVRHADYTEAQGAEVMAAEEIALIIQLGRGEAQYETWTCDLSHQYVDINSEYRS